jgi:hypothetical protein
MCEDVIRNRDLLQWAAMLDEVGLVELSPSMCLNYAGSGQQ